MIQSVPGVQRDRSLQIQVVVPLECIHGIIKVYRIMYLSAIMIIDALLCSCFNVHRCTVQLDAP